MRPDERTRHNEGDLLTGPGRSPEEAANLRFRRRGRSAGHLGADLVSITLHGLDGAHHTPIQIMTTGSAEFRPAHEPGGPVPIEELIRQQGVPAVRTVEDLATNDVFDSDEELDDSLCEVHGFSRRPV